MSMSFCFIPSVFQLSALSSFCKTFFFSPGSHVDNFLNNASIFLMFIEIQCFEWNRWVFQTSTLSPLLHIQPSNLIPSSAANCLLWPSLPLCLHLQKIMQILSHTPSLCLILHLLQIFPQNAQAMLVREADRAGKQVGNLHILTLPLVQIQYRSSIASCSRLPAVASPPYLYPCLRD